MKSLKKILLAVMLLMGMSVSVSADEIVGTWVYDKKTSVAQEKNEDLKMILGSAKTKNILFDKNGNYGDKKELIGKWKKTGPATYEVTAPNDPLVKASIKKGHLIMVADMGDWGIWTMYYTKK